MQSMRPLIRTLKKLPLSNRRLKTTIMDIPTPIPSAEYNTWKTSTFGKPFDIWHDGLAVERVTRLTGPARSTALQMLHYGLQTGDGDAATALCAMGETSAVAALQEALQGSNGNARVEIAKAIHTLAPADPSSTCTSDPNAQKPASDPMARELIAELERMDLHWGTKVDAAMGLRLFNDQESEDALLRSIARPGDDYLIKYHATESLLIRWPGAKKGITSHLDVFNLVRTPREGDELQDLGERGREAVKLLLVIRESSSSSNSADGNEK